MRSGSAILLSWSPDAAQLHIFKLFINQVYIRKRNDLECRIRILIKTVRIRNTGSFTHSWQNFFALWCLSSLRKFFPCIHNSRFASIISYDGIRPCHLMPNVDTFLISHVLVFLHPRRSGLVPVLFFLSLLLSLVIIISQPLLSLRALQLKCGNDSTFFILCIFSSHFSLEQFFLFLSYRCCGEPIWLLLRGFCKIKDPFLKVPSHQIRLAWKLYCWIGLDKYIDRGW